MKKLPVLALSVLCAVFLLAADKSKIPPLPVALTGNAVASLKSGIEVYSMMGVGTKKTWDDITSKVYVLRLKTGKWSEGQPVPGVACRLVLLLLASNRKCSFSAATRWMAREASSSWET